MIDERRNKVYKFCHDLDVDMTKMQYQTPFKSVSLSFVIVFKSL